MEIESALRRLLLADPTVNGYVAGKVFKYRLETEVDGTGGLAVVVFRDGGWAAPPPRGSSEYPKVWLRAYADPSRDAAGAVLEADAADKAWALYRACDRRLHGLRGVRVGAPVGNGLTLVSSARWAEPFAVTDDDMHGRSAASSAQGSSSGERLGDSVYVTAQYAVHTFH